MKVVILSHWFLPFQVGGSEWAVYNYAKLLSQRGHEVHVITQLDNKTLPSSELLEGFYVHRIKRWHTRIIGTLLYSLLAYRQIKKLKPDVIHEQGISGLGFSIKRLLRIPYVVFPQGTELYLSSELYKKIIVRRALDNADSCLALTQDMAREMQRICPKEITIIPNGVDLSRFESLSKGDARQKLGIDKRGQMILCVANLRVEKGHEYLIEAMGYVAKSHPEARLYLVGKGSQMGKTQDLVSSHSLQRKVVFAGFIPPDEIPGYMVAADTFVLPSLSEGFPLVLLEAMAAGLPIVATNVGGIPEIVTDGENGFLVEPRNSQQLAEKIALLLQNENIRKRFSTNNINKAKRYNWSEVVTALEKVYLKVKMR